MPLPVEIEVKYSVPGEAEFRRLLAAAGTPASVRTLLNCYLDGPRGELDSLGWMARIRLTEGEAALTLKAAVAKATDTPDGLFRAVEIERRISPRAVRAWIEGAGEARADLLDPGPQAPDAVRGVLVSGQAQVTTWAMTTRWTFREKGRPDLLADETWFPDGFRDFELEVECDDVTVARTRAESLARVASVSLTPQTATKHVRALQHARIGVPVPVAWVTRRGPQR